MNRYYALLSGEHPCMPHAELQAILDVEAEHYRVLLSLDGADIFEASIENPRIVAERSGWVKEVGLLYSVVEADEDEILEAARAIVERAGPPRRVEYRRYRQYAPHIDDKNLKLSLRVLEDPRGSYVLRVFISEGAAIIGRVLGRLDTRALHYRRPGFRPFFRPGPLMPQVTRAMINLARLRRGDVFVDPFCGTGGFPLEACMIGASRCYCADVNGAMVRGSRTNLEHYGLEHKSLSIAASATSIPIRDESLRSIATDPPYGRSTSPGRRGYRHLVSSFLREAMRVLAPGGYVVFAGPLGEEPHDLAGNAGFRIEARFHMHVHSTLVREVVVARKPG
ncbi:MAG: RsmD family RNA methyltransferase [Desulfurococcales archaeon]|nr:RsmD family RNA methyltransferase [Desulfurococcales archaeon]